MSSPDARYCSLSHDKARQRPDSDLLPGLLFYPDLSAKKFRVPVKMRGVSDGVDIPASVFWSVFDDLKGGILKTNSELTASGKVHAEDAGEERPYRFSVRDDSGRVYSAAGDALHDWQHPAVNIAETFTARVGDIVLHPALLFKEAGVSGEALLNGQSGHVPIIDLSQICFILNRDMNVASNDPGGLPCAEKRAAVNSLNAGTLQAAAGKLSLLTPGSGERSIRPTEFGILLPMANQDDAH